MPASKIAFCFLLYDSIVHQSTWESFFGQATSESAGGVSTHSIYAHCKKITANTPEWIADAAVKPVETAWCSPGLVGAWVAMLRAAYADPSNRYFVLLSGECIPIYNYATTYAMITRSKKSRIFIDKRIEGTPYYKAAQWMYLNRECARTLIALFDTKEGRQFAKTIDSADLGCPDEYYPVNWFIHKFGRPSSADFKRRFATDKMSTYVYWGPRGRYNSPPKMNRYSIRKVTKHAICETGALFARKYTVEVAANVAMKCGPKPRAGAASHSGR